MRVEEENHANERIHTLTSIPPSRNSGTLLPVTNLVNKKFCTT